MPKNIVKKVKRYLGQKDIVRICRSFTDIHTGYVCYSSLLRGDEEDREYLITPNGTGDIYIISQLYHSYLENRRIDEEMPCLVVPGRASETITRMFAIPGTRKVTAEETVALMLFWRFMGPDRLHGRVLHWGLASDHLSVLRPMEGVHGFNMYSMFQYAVFDGVERRQDSFPEAVDDKEVTKIFEKYALNPGKTVLLVPYSGSLRSLPSELFWRKLTAKLLQRGYSVVTNTAGPKEVPISGTQAVCFPIEQAVQFLNKAGYMISVRTGFADITESADCKRVILYPLIKNKRSQACSYHEMFSINEMFGRGRDIEIEYEVSNAEAVIPFILDSLEQK